jgi:transcriptional regulator with XRE-family HTH domain
MGVRSQLSWIVNGRAATQSTLESLTADLQALQLKVEALQPRLTAIEARQLDEFDKVRAAVADATDDLMARVDALRQRIDKS